MARPNLAVPLSAEQTGQTLQNDEHGDQFISYRQKQLAPWLLQQMQRLYPQQMQAVDCDYTQEMYWALPNWFFTPNGLYLEPSVDFRPSCQGPDWPYLPFSEVKKHPSWFQF